MSPVGHNPLGGLHNGGHILSQKFLFIINILVSKLIPSIQKVALSSGDQWSNLSAVKLIQLER